MNHRCRSFIDLPEDLQNNIFLRLPVKCLLFCKCVCKSFHTTIQNPDFINAHLSRPRPVNTETSRSLMLGLVDDSRIPYFKCQNHLLSIQSDGEILNSSPLTLPIPYVGALFLVGSCNGLICFDVRINYFASEYNFLLWNPVTKKTRYLPRLENRSEHHYQNIEFGFVSETNEYMVVIVSICHMSSDLLIELYKMSTDSWTVYCNTTVGKLMSPVSQEFSLDKEAPSVFSNGCFHWPTRCWIDHGVDQYILSYNLKDEELGLIKVMYHGKGSYFKQWKLTVVDEALAMIYWKSTDGIQIWVMIDYGVEDSWVLMFDLSYPGNMYPLGYWKFDLMIISLDGRYCLLDLNAGDSERIPIMRYLFLEQFCTFEESFAPIRRLL